MNSYRIGPLIYATELTLPELPPQPLLPDDRPVLIKLGRAPESLETVLAHAPAFEANDREFLLRIEDVAVFYVRDGDQIVIDPAAGGHELDIRAYLMGSLFAALCHQRGLLPLHASAIATPAGAVGFLGNSGDGKSSIAAFLERRGHRVLADDICVLDLEAPRNRRMLPVAPWLKLWDTTLEALGQPAVNLPPIITGEKKFRLALGETPSPTALAALFVLDRAEPDVSTTFTPLSPVQAVAAVLNLTFQAWLVRAMGRTDRYFLRCGRALEGVRVLRMRRPWGFTAMPDVVAAVEAQLQEMAAGPL